MLWGGASGRRPGMRWGGPSGRRPGMWSRRGWSRRRLDWRAPQAGQRSRCRLAPAAGTHPPPQRVAGAAPGVGRQQLCRAEAGTQHAAQSPDRRLAHGRGRVRRAQSRAGAGRRGCCGRLAEESVSHEEVTDHVGTQRKGQHRDHALCAGGNNGSYDIQYTGRNVGPTALPQGALGHASTGRPARALAAAGAASLHRAVLRSTAQCSAVQRTCVAWVKKRAKSGRKTGCPAASG
jgi:hypothetical protein